MKRWAAFASVILTGVAGCLDTCQYVYSQSWESRGAFQAITGNATINGTRVTRFAEPPAVTLIRNHGSYHVEIVIALNHSSASMDGPRLRAPKPVPLIRETYDSIGLIRFAPNYELPNQWDKNCIA